MTGPSSRVLVDARVGWGSGIGRYVSNALPRVARLLPTVRFDVLVEARDAARAGAVLGQAPNLRIRATEIRSFSLSEQVALPRLAREYDLSWFTNYWVPLRWAGPFVATVHDLLHLEADLFDTSAVKRRLSRATFRKVQRQAQSVMFVSRFTQRRFHQLIGAPRSEAVTHLGINHAEWSDRPLRPWKDKERRLLIVAAAKKHKNFERVVRAWAAAQVAPEWCLTIVMPNDQQLRSSIDLAGLTAGNKKVELRQDLSNAAIRDLYDSAAVVLTPSLYEGFGLPLLEGLQAGAVCVSATASASVEMAQGAFVHFVDARDSAGWTAAIESTCHAADEDRFDFAALSAFNRSVVQRFQWEATSAQIAETLAEALHR